MHDIVTIRSEPDAFDAGLARRGAELDPAMKIVFITGFAAVALSSGSPTPAGAKVLSKPFHLREIVEEVDKVMAA